MIQAKEAEFRAIWRGCELRNGRIRAALGMEFRALDVSIRDCMESLLSIAKVEPKLKQGLSPEFEEGICCGISS